MKTYKPVVAGMIEALVLLWPGRVLASEEGGMLPPVVRDMMVILAVVLSVLVLIGLMVVFATVKTHGDRIGRVERWSKTIKSLASDVDELKKLTFPAPEEAPPSPFLPPKPEEVKNQPPVWQEFLADYNNLARSVDVPRVEQACDNFIELHEIRLLMCLSKQGQDKAPRFAPVSEVDADFWAWRLPTGQGKFAVVPNPTITYTEKLHEEGGMKETFASNYDTGIYRHVEVKLPAIFLHKDDTWTIEQPGVIRLGG